MTIQAVQAQTPEKKITSLLVTMGHKVDRSVDQAITALLDSNTHVVAGLMENEVAIQELELAIDQAVFAALESGDLLPSEIRQVTSMVNISRDLARLGKLAANLGGKVSQVGEHHDHEDFSSLQPLAIAVAHLCRQTLRALTRLDPVLARNAAEGGASVDAYRNYVLRALPAPTAAPVNDEQNIHLIFASRCLEQIADRAHDLAENLLAFLCGPMPRNSQPHPGTRMAC
ncbi:MAG: phosphate uptake regulator PhoU [Candidatus Angelobacter sp.]